VGTSGLLQQLKRKKISETKFKFIPSTFSQMTRVQSRPAMCVENQWLGRAEPPSLCSRNAHR